MTRDRDYVLGTHDAEIERLGLQHRVWRDRARAAWERAGFGAGQTLIDLGCGPGHATLDLARLVGPDGHVIAIDRSRRFLDALEAAGPRAGLGRITALERDLDQDELGVPPADGAWARWVFAFVRSPRALVAHVRRALVPGGVLVLHEYLHYAAWRLSPRSPDFESFVTAVIESWRAAGGEPDVGLDLPRWLEASGFEVRTVTPIADVLTPNDPAWAWPAAFVESGLARLIELGRLDAARARAVAGALAAAEATPGVRMVTPTVVEIVAVRT